MLLTGLLKKKKPFGVIYLLQDTSPLRAAEVIGYAHEESPKGMT